MNFDAIQIDRSIERNIQVGRSVQAGGIDVNVVSSADQGRGEAVNRSNWTSIADRRIVVGHDLQDSQPGWIFRQSCLGIPRTQHMWTAEHNL